MASPTSAPVAAQLPTELTAAVEHRKHHPCTPYNPSAWERALLLADPLRRFSDIPAGFRDGFIINFPNIISVQSPPNSLSIATYESEFMNIVRKEVLKGRYLNPAPLSEILNVIGPYQSSPLSIVPKPGKPGKFRLVQNFSFPTNPSISYPLPSINSYVDSSLFPTTWGKFSTVYLLAARLPDGSEAATRDVSEAYRTVPLHPSQWPAAIVKISDSLGCVDTCLSFGASPSAGVYGHIADAAAEIFRHNGIGPLDKWVDDHIFFRIRRDSLADYNLARKKWHQEISPAGIQHTRGRIWYSGRTLSDSTSEEFNEDCSAPLIDHSTDSPRSRHDAFFTYNISDIDAISSELGIPWEMSKDQPFHTSTVYIGFVWDLKNLTVSLTDEKAAKYIAAINAWKSRATHVYREVAQLYGKLLHTTALLP